jgi:hypothetical protein
MSVGAVPTFESMLEFERSEACEASFQGKRSAPRNMRPASGRPCSSASISTTFDLFLGAPRVIHTYYGMIFNTIATEIPGHSDGDILK